MHVSHPDLIVLGLLADEPRHGYEIRRRIESMELRHWARIGDSTVYAALRRLEARGVVERETMAGSARPDRQVYRLTPAGRERLADLVREALSSGVPTYSDRLVGGVFALAVPGTEPALDGAIESAEGALSRLREAARADGLSPVGAAIVRFNRAVKLAELRALRELRGLASAPAACAPIPPSA